MNKKKKKSILPNGWAEKSTQLGKMLSHPKAETTETPEL